MSYSKGLHPGATWRKTDFQIHTPRDAGWSGSSPLPGGDAPAEGAREAWADEFVAACLDRDLGAIAITDHHDLVMFPYVKRAIERATASEKLWLFPGMEVTCNDSVQCLILFDKGTTPETIKRIFGHLPKIIEPSEKVPQAPQTELCGKDIRQFLESTYDDEAFKGRMIILPHASKGGHKDILRKGFHTRFADLQVDGVYTEKPYTAFDDQTRKMIYGEIKAWGERRRGIITTGDNRSADWKSLGTNQCWIRLGEPTSEAIRQAVLADEARISYEMPDRPNHRILKLSICSTLTGPNFALSLNDGFNAIIGGRGSGKSSLLEYLRFGLGRSTVDMPEDTSLERERGLIESTLVGGFVAVTLERDGVQETWKRTLEQQAHITISTKNGDELEVSIASAQERFRARAFYQKQLSTLVRRRETADEQITGIAAAELVDRRQQCEREIDEAERKIHAAFQRVVQSWSATAAFESAKNARSDLQRRLEATRQRLESEGLSQQQQAVLNEAPIYARTENQFITSARLLAEQLSALDELPNIRTEGWEGTVQSDEVIAAKEKLAAGNAAIIQLRSETRNIIDNLSQQLSSAHSKFKIRHAEFRSRLAEANVAQAHLGTLLTDYKRITDDLEKAERREKAAQDAGQRFLGADTKLAEARDALANQLTEMKSILSDAATRVEAMSNGVLRARVEEESAPVRFYEALVDLCEKCSIRELDQKCMARVEELARDSRIEWDKLVNALLNIRRTRVRSGDTGELDPNAAVELRAALGWELTDNQARLVLARLDDARLARILSAWAAPFVRFEYKDRGAYMPFERASPGQQASALLTLLLNQEAGTLVIDQPEDDLDNRVIMDVVKLLQKTKRKRQLIFATHNPNFVVNGDADKIIALAPSVDPNAMIASPAAQIEIETDGAIETPSVRLSITETMEGGQQAFELRSRKYAFET